jgi:hypothetical protein
MENSHKKFDKSSPLAYNEHIILYHIPSTFMKKSFFISICALLICCFPALTQAQNYVEGEVIVKYKNAEFQTTAQGIQLILPQEEQITTQSIPTPYASPLLSPCETISTLLEPTEATEVTEATEATTEQEVVTP